MKTIWKYELETTDGQSIDMPIGAEILTVQMQNGSLCLWAKVDSDAPKERRKILIRGTGNSIGEVVAYIGTFQLAVASLVFHVFEAS